MRLSRTSRVVVAGATAAVLALSMAACGGGDQAAPSPSPSPSLAPSPSPSPSPDPFAQVGWPLTGVQADNIVDRPALAVKIENAPEARPQQGLENADVVWEEVVEGGITRFVAVYNSDIPESVAPVRSARPMDAGVVAPLGGILAFSGAQQVFIDQIKAAGIQTVIMDAGNAGFAREQGRRAPHNVIGTMQAFLDQADSTRKSPPPRQFLFAHNVGEGTASATGTPAASLDIKMSGFQTTGWAWDAASGTWLRSDNGKAAMSVAGTQLSARNVVILSMEMVNTPFVDPAGTPVPETIMVGTGDAVIASGGKTVTATWAKADTGAVMELTGADGKPILLDPGNTWVQMVPRGTGSWTLNP